MKKFLETYENLGVHNLDVLETIYTSDIFFTDPAHEIKGLKELRRYFENLYQNIRHIRFEFFHPVQVDHEGYVSWRMTYSHSRLNAGKEIAVSGATFLRFVNDMRVNYHRDYFDLGQMVYQHIPVVGPVIKAINRRIGT